jgi:hypothetical protein
MNQSLVADGSEGDTTGVLRAAKRSPPNGLVWEYLHYFGVPFDRSAGNFRNPMRTISEPAHTAENAGEAWERFQVTPVLEDIFQRAADLHTFFEADDSAAAPAPAQAHDPGCSDGSYCTRRNSGPETFTRYRLQ